MCWVSNTRENRWDSPKDLSKRTEPPSPPCSPQIWPRAESSPAADQGRTPEHRRPRTVPPAHVQSQHFLEKNNNNVTESQEKFRKLDMKVVFSSHLQCNSSYTGTLMSLTDSNALNYMNKATNNLKTLLKFRAGFTVRLTDTGNLNHTISLKLMLSQTTHSVSS